MNQIGFVVLVGLACKSAILFVVFAKAEEDRDKTRIHAAVEACRLRLRRILMTVFSFILGTIPCGTAVFGGMLGVTLFGLFLTPVFDVVFRKFGRTDLSNSTTEN